MRISINLATRPFADIGPRIKQLRIAAGVLAVVGIALGFGLHALHSKAEAARAREHSLDGEIARINGERQGYESMMRQPDNAALLNEVQNLNRLFDEKSFSWTLAMEDLETVLPGGVQVTTLEPIRDEKTGQITLRLRVVGPRDKAVTLVSNLERSRHFITPRIVGESAENNGQQGASLEPVSASNRVTFEVLADYDTAKLGEKDMSATKPDRSEKAKGISRSKVSHAAAPAITRPAHATGPGAQHPAYTGVAHPGQVRQPAPQNSILKPQPGEPK